MKIGIVGGVLLLLCTVGASALPFSYAPGPYSPEVMRFISGQSFSDRGPQLHQNAIVVYLDAAKTRPTGVAAFTLDETMDCAKHKLTSVYTAYNDSAAAISTTESPTPDAVTLAHGPYPPNWEARCNISTGKSLPPPPAHAPPLMRGRYATTVSEALALAKRRESDNDAAAHLPNDGHYEIIMTPQQPGQGVALIDYTKLDTKAAVRDVSWLYVDQSGLYLRSDWTVDCTKQTGARNLVVFFNPDGSLRQVIDDYVAQTWDMLGDMNVLFRLACKLEKPGWLTPVYRSFPEALDGGRANLH